MVKPVYPHEKHRTVLRNVSQNRSSRNEGQISDDEVEGAVGYSPSASQITTSEAFLPCDDDDVFQYQDSETASNDFLPSSSVLISANTFSNTCPAQKVHKTAPVPTPRERISSLPERDGSQVPRERRRSAPAQPPSNGHPTDLPPALKDIAFKGQELFWFILSEEVKAREVENPGSLSSLTIPTSAQRLEILNERGQNGGKTLRQIAEAFAHSTQRLRVRNFSEQVDLQSLNYDSFSDLLFGLFQDGGVTQARVLVLFFFCSDVALRALRERLTYRFQQLVDWTSRYITERLSSWVLDHGGWAAVLLESVDQALKMTMLGLCCVSILACSIFILHRFQS